jgi:hypothetical protein
MYSNIIYGNSSREVFPYGEDFPYTGSLPTYGKTSNIWEDFPRKGRLPICAKTSHMCEDFPYMNGKTLHR